MHRSTVDSVPHSSAPDTRAALEGLLQGVDRISRGKTLDRTEAQEALGESLDLGSEERLTKQQHTRWGLADAWRKSHRQDYGDTVRETIAGREFCDRDVDTIHGWRERDNKHPALIVNPGFGAAELYKQLIAPLCDRLERFKGIPKAGRGLYESHSLELLGNMHRISPHDILARMPESLRSSLGAYDPRKEIAFTAAVGEYLKSGQTRPEETQSALVTPLEMKPTPADLGRTAPYIAVAGMGIRFVDPASALLLFRRQLDMMLGPVAKQKGKELRSMSPREYDAFLTEAAKDGTISGLMEQHMRAWTTFPEYVVEQRIPWMCGTPFIAAGKPIPPPRTEYQVLQLEAWDRGIRFWSVDPYAALPGLEDIGRSYGPRMAV